ncbi:tubulin-specific chaperone D isoform 1 [Corchorus olitorius]|uniref:Tubulin-specific chaperone D isoform 1 n=1 Tax=Corchorus olitorius TaxID=93759 RepID=A0A1R3H307_9ROSI|nr:tubulin-specific chaperone D isoform 1 [Corchorus olitorius]
MRERDEPILSQKLVLFLFLLLLLLLLATIELRRNPNFSLSAHSVEITDLFGCDKSEQQYRKSWRSATSIGSGSPRALTAVLPSPLSHPNSENHRAEDSNFSTRCHELTPADASEAFSLLFGSISPDFMNGMQQISAEVQLSSDLCMRHGATLAAGELVLALH